MSTSTIIIAITILKIIQKDSYRSNKHHYHHRDMCHHVSFVNSSYDTNHWHVIVRSYIPALNQIIPYHHMIRHHTVPHNTMVQQRIHPFIHSFIHWLSFSSMHPFIHSSIHAFIDSVSTSDSSSSSSSQSPSLLAHVGTSTAFSIICLPSIASIIVSTIYFPILIIPFSSIITLHHDVNTFMYTAVCTLYRRSPVGLLQQRPVSTSCTNLGGCQSWSAMVVRVAELQVAVWAVNLRLISASHRLLWLPCLQFPNVPKNNIPQITDRFR